MWGDKVTFSSDAKIPRTDLVTQLTFLFVSHLGQDLGRWVPVLRQIIVITVCFAVTTRRVISGEKETGHLRRVESKMTVALGGVGFLRRKVFSFSLIL